MGFSKGVGGSQTVDECALILPTGCYPEHQTCKFRASKCNLWLMDPVRFVSDRFGSVRYDGFAWFDPAPLPDDLELDSATWMALSRADDALGRLAGVARLLRHKDTLVNLYCIKEALASSRIEGTQAELKTALQVEARPQVQRHFPEVVTVLNLARAMGTGMARVRDDGRVTVGLMLALHKLLVPDDGGVVRDHNVWVGSPTDRAETADFVPPIPSRVRAALDEWEGFAAATSSLLPPLIRAAMLHYQFLTIHPFHDGNGRVARILVPLYLAAQGRLPEPLLYLSPYFEKRRREYADRLQAVRERGEIQEWIQFFLTAVEEQAKDGVDRAERLLDLMDRYRDELAGSRSRSVEVVDLLFRTPVLSATEVRTTLNMSHQGALNLIRGLEKRGWLVPTPSKGGRGGGQVWLAQEVFDAVDGPPQKPPPPMTAQPTGA